MQDSQANCGPFALKNALASLGIDRSAEELERACGTTATSGTPTRGIIRAAAGIAECRPLLLREKRRDVALMRLSEALRRGRPAVLSWNCEEAGDHWVAAIGILGERYLIADSGDSELVMSYPVQVLEEKWRDTKYEGVIL